MGEVVIPMSKATKPYPSLNNVEALYQTKKQSSANSLEQSLISQQSLPLGVIELNPSQPRRYFDSEKLSQLVSSIQSLGVIEPILVRPKTEGRYELVAGERRYRAATDAGLTEVPVLIRNLSDQQALEIALVENLQREDLNPVEETEGILQLLAMSLDISREAVIALLNQKSYMDRQNSEITDTGIRSQWEQVKDIFGIIGKLTPESFRVNRLPLLNLPVEVLDAIREGLVEYSKARLIARIKDENTRSNLLSETITHNLTREEIQSRILEIRSLAEKETITEEGELKEKLNNIVRRMKKVNLSSSQRTKAIKLLTQMESLLNSIEK